MWFRRKITDKRLMYSATERCKCGAGLAFTRKMDAWECSDLLKGEELPGAQHSGPIPFTERAIKMEAQLSANGQTTRPASIEEIMNGLANFSKRLKEQ